MLLPYHSNLEMHGGIVEKIDYSGLNKLALDKYQKKRLERQIEDEEILAVIIAISKNYLH